MGPSELAVSVTPQAKQGVFRGPRLGVRRTASKHALRRREIRATRWTKSEIPRGGLKEGEGALGWLWNTAAWRKGRRLGQTLWRTLQ